MKAFQCACGQPLFFHNHRCLACGAEVGFDPLEQRLGALAAVGDGTWTCAGDARSSRSRFRFCEHRTSAAACNWLVPSWEAHRSCLSCRLTRTIPDLSRPKNLQRLADIEAAKRHVLFGFMACGLPIVPKAQDEVRGLAFDLLEPLHGGAPVTTGHAGGLVTINVAEADDDYREMHREGLKEPYRTIIGHLRHELGHYYWDLLIRDGAWLEPFRRLFGDERTNYADALARHYRNGPPPDWPDRFISSYAASHPWEDWAETWAHFHHMRATLQTVASFGLATAVHAVPHHAVRDRCALRPGRAVRRKVPRVDERLGHSHRRAERDLAQHGAARPLPVRAEPLGGDQDALHPVRHGFARRRGGRAGAGPAGHGVTNRAARLRTRRPQR